MRDVVWAWGWVILEMYLPQGRGGAQRRRRVYLPGEGKIFLRARVFVCFSVFFCDFRVFFPVCSRVFFSEALCFLAGSCGSRGNARTEPRTTGPSSPPLFLP